MFNIVSYILGKKEGEKNINLESDNYTFSDDGNNNVEIKENNNGQQTIKNN